MDRTESKKTKKSFLRGIALLLMLLLSFAAGSLVNAGAVRASEEDPAGTRGILEDYVGGFVSMFGEERALKDAVVEKIPDQRYTGRSVTPVPKITYLGMRLRKGTDFTVTYTDNRSVGTARCRITGKGKYKGTKTVTFKIVRKTGTTSSSSSQTARTGSKTFRIRLSQDTYIYNGDYRKPTVKVTLGGKAVTASHYTVKYTGNRNVGTATVTVTGKGDYKGCKGTAKFTIQLKKPTITSLKSGEEGELAVSWTKDSQADGYQVQYCTRKAFNSGDKVKYIRSRSTDSTTITRMTSGKKYYVRVRSYKKVGSRNQYSDWSTAKEKLVR